MLLVGLESKNNWFRVWERAKWMVCHSDPKRLDQKLLSVIHRITEYER